MKVLFRIFLTLLVLFPLSGCASFKPANIDETTGLFPASTVVDKQYIKIYELLSGIKEVNFVYLLAHSPYGDDRFYSFMRDALIKMGFTKVYSRKELSRMVIQNGLSAYITDLSDPISLNNLAKATGPFIIIDSRVFPVADVVFRFDVQVIEPLSGDTYLEISRIRTNWLDMDKEINYPILNVIKQWHDESAKLPCKKHKDNIPKEKMI